MKRTKILSFGLCTLGVATGLFGCATNAALENGNVPGGSVNVSQGGAQDIAEFRKLVSEGKVPSTSTLDPVGFFAEHAIDLPDADCGKDICIHPFLAVAPRFNGGNWTMAFVAMNTAVDPSKLERPPVHLAVSIETSQFDTSAMSTLKNGLASLLQGLRPEDRLTLISFESKAERHVFLAEPDAPAIEQGINAIVQNAFGGSGLVGLYDGIAATEQAFQDGDDAGFVGEHRVLLLTSGHATAGITDPSHVLALGEGMVQDGAAFGVVGVGETYDAQIPAALGGMGAGTYSYAQNPQDLIGVLDAEGQTTLFPLATDFTLDVIPSKGYHVGRIYGTKRATHDASGASLSLPALFIGQRDGASDVGGSRRGGGGGLFVELYANPADAATIGAGAPAFEVVADWQQAGTGAAQSIDTTLKNTLPPGENPESMWWNISDGSSGKPYMMLNMYLALRGSLSFYESGDCARSLGVIEMMQDPVSMWLGKYPDTDITDDNNLMLMLKQNIETACETSSTAVEPIAPSDFDGGCAAL